MKIITSLIYDLSFLDHVNKQIFLARINSAYYVWIQDEGVNINPEEVIRNASPTKNIKVANDIFNFYKTYMDKCYTEEFSPEEE